MLRIASIVFVLLTCAASVCAQPRHNLPQRADRFPIPPDARERLRAAEASGMGADVLETLPVDFRTACGDVVRAWGASARGTAVWSVRELHREKSAARVTLLVALRCSSSQPAYAGFADERAALVLLLAGASHLQLIPLAEDCANCSELFRVAFERIHPAEGAALWELRVASSSKNPCCDGPSSDTAERVLLVRASDGRTVLEIETLREIREHDDESGDTEEICRADVAISHDNAGKLAAIAVTRRCTLDGKAQPETTREHRWNPARRVFELPD